MPNDSNAVFWPRGAKTIEAKPLAPRVASLEGKTVAFLWDYLFRGDEVFPIVQRELTMRFPGMRFIGHDEFGSTHGEDEHQILATLPERLTSLGADAVVSGMGC